MTIRFFATMFISSIALVAVGQDLKTEKEKTSYAVGMSLGNVLTTGKDLLDVGTLMLGITDALDGRDSLLNESELKSLFLKWQNEAREKQAADQSKEGAAFLETNQESLTKLWKDAVVEVRRDGYVDGSLHREDADHCGVDFDVVDLTHLVQKTDVNEIEKGIHAAA